MEEGRVEIDKDPVSWVAEVSRSVALREAAITQDVAVREPR